MITGVALILVARGIAAARLTNRGVGSRLLSSLRRVYTQEGGAQSREELWRCLRALLRERTALGTEVFALVSIS